MGMIEGMAKGFIQGVEKDVESIDSNKDGHPDLPQALALIKQGEEALATYFPKMNIAALLAQFCPEIPVAELPALEQDVRALFAGVKLVEGIAEELYQKRFK